SATCSAGQCEFVCQIGFADCDELEENDCEASLDEPTTCGSCTNDCTGVLANVAQAACEAGACGIGECAVGWLDCDGSAANGCETNAFLVNSCGSCGPTNCYACGLDGCTTWSRWRRRSSTIPAPSWPTGASGAGDPIPRDCWGWIAGWRNPRSRSESIFRRPRSRWRDPSTSAPFSATARSPVGAATAPVSSAMVRRSVGVRPPSSPT